MVDRFLRVNSRRAAAGLSGSEPTQTTIIVQAPPQPVPVQPSFIANENNEAKVSCDVLGFPRLEASVRGYAVLRSDYGDGTNGYTTLQSPNLNVGVTVGPASLFLNAEYIGPDRVLTCMDPEGRAQWQPPTKLLSPVDPIQCYLKMGSYNIDLATNWDQPTGKLNLRIQPFSTAGQVLTAMDNEGYAQWQDLPPVQPSAPSPSIFASNVGVPVNLVTTQLYDPAPITSTNTTFWTTTVDTTFTVASGANFTIQWALFNSLGVQYGPTTSTTIGTSGAETIVRISYQYTFYQVFPTQIRFTATSTIANGTTTTVRLPANFLSIDPNGGIPFIRMLKSSARVVTAVSRSAYYNVLNWTPAPLAFAAMRMMGEAEEVQPIKDVDTPSEEAQPIKVVDAPSMAPPEKEDFPLTMEGVTTDAIDAITQQGLEIKDQLVYVYKKEEDALHEHADALHGKLDEVCGTLITGLEEECAPKRQRLI